jgi:predicted RNA-binding Zn ribbon-like protein
VPVTSKLMLSGNVEGVGDVIRMELVGGHSAVDFVNTLGGLPDDPDDEYLHGYADLLTFVEHCGLLDRRPANALRRAAAGDVTAAEKAFAAALALRAAVDAALRLHAIGTAPRSVRSNRHVLDALRDAYADSLAAARLERADESYDWVWPTSVPSLRLPYWLVAGQAVDLLRLDDLARLRQCAHCRWLFLDTSKNHSRRWCSMNACGSVVKMRRFRARQRAEAGDR